MTSAYVYVLRSNARLKKGSKRAVRKTATQIVSAAPATAPPKAAFPASEVTLRKALAELGLARARTILSQVEKTFAGA